MTYCLWFNSKSNNRTSTWWAQEFVQDRKIFRNYGRYSRNNSAQDYHDMIGKIFWEMKEIHDNGDILLTLDLGSGKKYDVIKLPVIQFIINDCKGNELL